jgi:hypothetical protein
LQVSNQKQIILLTLKQPNFVAGGFVQRDESLFHPRSRGRLLPRLGLHCRPSPDAGDLGRVRNLGNGTDQSSMLKKLFFDESQFGEMVAN